MTEEEMLRSFFARSRGLASGSIVLFVIHNNCSYSWDTVWHLMMCKYCAIIKSGQLACPSTAPLYHLLVRTRRWRVSGRGGGRSEEGLPVKRMEKRKDAEVWTQKRRLSSCWKDDTLSHTFQQDVKVEAIPLAAGENVENWHPVLIYLHLHNALL